MPLHFTDARPRYDSATGTVRLTAQDQTGRQVICAVSQEGLADLARSTAMGEAVLPIYLENAALIQGIATEKYDRKRIRADGVVVISSGDLAAYG
jgi:hypothetical protein